MLEEPAHDRVATLVVGRQLLLAIGHDMALALGAAADPIDSLLELGHANRFLVASRGEDARPVEPDREAKSYGEENTFARDIVARERLVEAIRAHAEAVARRLRRDRVRGRRITLKLKLARPLGGGRYPLVTRALTLAEATDDGSAIAAAGRALLARAAPGEAIRLLGVAVSRLEPADSGETGLLAIDAETARRARLNRAVDAIHARFGDAALRRGADGERRAGLSHGIKRGED